MRREAADPETLGSRKLGAPPGGRFHVSLRTKSEDHVERDDPVLDRTGNLARKVTAAKQCGPWPRRVRPRAPGSGTHAGTPAPAASTRR